MKRLLTRVGVRKRERREESEVLVRPVPTDHLERSEDDEADVSGRPENEEIDAAEVCGRFCESDECTNEREREVLGRTKEEDV